MIYCVICLTEVIPVFNWTYFLSKEPPFYLCDGCKQKLVPIVGECCTICNRPLVDLDASFIYDDICHDCKRWEENSKWKGVLKQNYSLFLYNDFLKEVIARFKYRGDYQIAGAFSLYIPKKLFHNKVAIPIPLSKVRLYERGFNQTEAILHGAGIPSANCLTRMHSEKQSKKTRAARLEAETVFAVENNKKIISQDVILVDDIYTTGATLHHAAMAVKEAGAKSVVSFTIAR